MPHNLIPSCAARLGLFRPKGFISPNLRKALAARRQKAGSHEAAPAPAAAAPVAVIATDVPPPTLPPTSSDLASFSAVARWASERGIAFSYASDFPRVNAKRRQLGLPLFVLQPGRT